MSDNYVILIDENGQPYIAHSIFSNARQKGAKYIEKIKNGAKTRYFYTKAELDAYYNKGKQKVQDTAKKAKNISREITGKAAKDRLDAAQKDYRNKLRTNQDVDYLFNINADKRDVARARGDIEAAKKYQKEVEKYFEKKYKISKNDFETYLRTGKLYTREGTYDKQAEAYENYKKAIKEYEKTPLGKLEQSKNVINRGKDIIKEYASDKIAKIKDKLGYDEKEAYKKAKADYKPREIDIDAYDSFILNALKDPDNFLYKDKKLKKALKDIQDRAIASRDRYEKALAEYKDTPLGKLENAKNIIKVGVDNIKVSDIKVQIANAKDRKRFNDIGRKIGKTGKENFVSEEDMNFYIKYLLDHGTWVYNK